MDLLAWWRFDSPGYLALLALIPILIALSFRSLSGLGPIRRGLALAIRCLVVMVIILALADSYRTQEMDDLSVIFLVDRSNSIPPDLQRSAFEFIEQANEARPQDDRLGVIAFDATADVEQLPMNALALDALGRAADPDQTDLAGAVRMGLALLPSETSGRLVLISDGNQNVGNVLQEAERLGAAGIPIDVVPILYEHPNEVVFETLKAPPTAEADETVNLQMVLRSQQAASGRIMLEHNGRMVDLDPDGAGAGYPVTLEPGPNRFVIPVPLRVAGAHRFKTRFVPDNPSADTVEDNNTGQSFTVVSGQGKILILTQNDDYTAPQSSARILAAALEAEGLFSDIQVAGREPLDQVRLLEYSAVVLNNVPAGDFRDEEKQTLAVYVRDLGGGLIMLGGDDSFGAGGWLGSPVEDVMPVSFDVQHKKQFLKGALALVMHACEVERGNYIGERCAIEAVKTLSSRDLVGVLAWQWMGDDRGHWVVPLQEVGSRSRIIAAIKQMSMGDLPDLDEVMRPGVQALAARKDVGPKHMIIVSDFDPQAPRKDLIKTMQDNGITCSTIAIGYGSHFIDESKAQWIANSTGGRFYTTRDFSKLPQIFVKESREIRRSLVQEGLFRPQLVSAISPVIPGLTGEQLPTLGGFVLTTRRPLAEMPLSRVSEEGDEDPILAHWQVGLGKTVAFTSGMWPRWGPNWTAWPRFSKLWAQTVRWASRQAESAAFDVTTTVHGGRARIRIDAVDKNADVINFMEVAGTLVDPEQQAQPLQLVQTGPGRYEAEFDARERGNYIVNLAYRMGEGEAFQTGALRTGVSIAYSPEYSQLEPNEALLEQIRQRTGGRRLGKQNAAEVFDRSGLARAEARHAMWETLLQWMLVLFLLDVAVRRIAVNPAETARRVRRRLGEAAGRGGPQRESEATLTSLKGARDRVRDEQRDRAAEHDEQVPPRPGARFDADAADARSTEELSKALGGATEQDTPVVARPTGKKPAQSEGEYTSRLLKAKKRARDEIRREKGDDQQKPDKQD